jgi:hypothetical protein
LPNSVLITILLCLQIGFHYSFPCLILLVMYYIAHIDMVNFQICVPSCSTLLLQYRAQNLDDREVKSPSMVKVLMVSLANTLKEWEKSIFDGMCN